MLNISISFLNILSKFVRTFVAMSEIDMHRSDRTKVSTVATVTSFDSERVTLGTLRARTDIQMLFSRTLQDLQRQNSRVFQDSKIFFPGFSRKRSIQNIGCTRSKSAYTKSVIGESALK